MYACIAIAFDSYSQRENEGVGEREREGERVGGGDKSTIFVCGKLLWHYTWFILWPYQGRH